MTIRTLQTEPIQTLMAKGLSEAFEHFEKNVCLVLRE
jgi:hypothetical protein